MTIIDPTEYVMYQSGVNIKSILTFVQEPSEVRSLR